MPPLRKLVLAALALAVCLCCTADGYWRVGAQAHFDGEQAAGEPLARSVSDRALDLDRPFTPGTGSSRFDGEWALATCQMTVIGLAQFVEAHPETAETYLPAIRACSDWLLGDDALTFGEDAWGYRPLGGHGFEDGHAYLGYTNLALGKHRAVDPEFAHTAEHDAITRALARRLDASPTGLIETYPNEIYAPDNAAVAASIQLHDSLTGHHNSATLARWRPRFIASAFETETGLLYQSSRRDGSPYDVARGSGTAVASWFLAVGGDPLSKPLYDALIEQCWGRPLGFGALREVPDGSLVWDIDSGPVVFGYGMTATGFGLGAARAHGDREHFVAMYRTHRFGGVPVRWGSRRSYLLGEDIGNAIMLAMLTTPRAG